MNAAIVWKKVSLVHCATSHFWTERIAKTLFYGLKLTLIAVADSVGGANVDPSPSKFDFAINLQLHLIEIFYLSAH